MPPITPPPHHPSTTHPAESWPTKVPAAASIESKGRHSKATSEGARLREATVSPAGGREPAKAPKRCASPHGPHGANRAHAHTTAATATAARLAVLADEDEAAHEVCVVQVLDGALRILLIAVLNQRAPLGPSVGLEHNVDVHDVQVPVRAAHVVLEILPLDIPREVAQIHAAPRRATGLVEPTSAPTTELHEPTAPPAAPAKAPRHDNAAARVASTEGTAPARASSAAAPPACDRGWGGDFRSILHAFRHFAHRLIGRRLGLLQSLHGLGVSFARGEEDQKEKKRVA